MARCLRTIVGFEDNLVSGLRALAVYFFPVALQKNSQSHLPALRVGDEDTEDLRAFETTRDEPNLRFYEVLADLKRRSKQEFTATFSEERR